MREGFVKPVLAGGALLLLALLPGAALAEGDEGVVDEVLAILRDRGLVDEAQYMDLVSRNSAYEKQEESPFGRIEWYGDLRGRFEGFWFADDPSGSDSEDREDQFRGRYRLRIGAKVPIHDWLTADFQLASGQNDLRSTNRTLGRDDDFGPDEIFIDRAYLTLHPPSDGRWGSLALQAGKTPNPFTGKRGKDWMIWDNDINPEGVALTYRVAANEDLALFGNAGYFILEENSGASGSNKNDPKLVGLQGGFEAALSESVALGGRLSGYSFRSLGAGDDFFTAGIEEGNLALSDEPSDSFDAGEFYGYLGFSGIADWPMLLYGSFARNFDALGLPGLSEQDDAWGVGFEVGDKKQLVMLGAGYWHIEANAWPAQFTDSDLFDGRTNREGWAFYGSRQLFRNTDLNIALFVGDAIEDGARFDNGADDVLSGADRVRLQTDLAVKF